MYWQTEGDDGYYIECDQQISNTNGWTVQTRGVYILNDTHALDSFDFQIYFVSNTANTQLGVYIDDFQLSGTPFSVDLQPLAIIPTNSLGAPSETILYSGQNTWVDWIALNYGSGSTNQAFRVEYFLDGNSIGGTTFSGVEANAQASTHDYPVFIGEPGPHTLSMIVDYNQDIAESFENNNVHQITRTWLPPPRPDLDITSFTASNPSPEPGSTITYQVVVKNIGQVSSAVWTQLDLYVNRQFPPGTGLPGDLTASVPPLLPGESTVVPLQVTSAVAGEWLSYAQADPFNVLEEATPGGEDNNTAGPVAVSWQAG
jgi:subtilase family serine protease